MPKIHQLPEHVVAKIAAGEVIERPAYAVKELIENAIDAHASTVKVIIEQSGLGKIEIIDNGIGMEKEDVLTCFKPHTTSKIKDETDLFHIQSLGFRGEALASIAAISEMTVQSRTQNSVAGFSVAVKYGDVIEEKPVGMPQGTTIIVKNLFANVPARKKFLKSAQTEMRHILEVVTHFAIAYPEIRFTLLHNNRIILDLTSEKKIDNRLPQLLGTSLYQQSIPMKFEDGHVALSGFLVKPHLNAKTTNKQFLFVNKRRVVHKLISLAVKDAYATLLESNKYPMFILFIQTPVEMVDVNVHPQKELVHFSNNETIYEIVKQAVSKTLEQNNLNYHNFSFVADDFRPGKTDTFAAQLLRETVTPWNVKTKIDTDGNIQQLHNVYLLASTKQGLVLVDQHAAHERILYEQLKAEFTKHRQSPQQTMPPKPIQLDLSPTEKELLDEHQTELEKLGFSFDKTSNVIKIPTLLKDRNIKKIINELLEDFEQEKGVQAIDEQSDRMLKYLACRSAIMAGDKLTSEESRRLIEELEKTPNNATCPHGRPTKIEISKAALDRMFKRK